MSLIFWKVVGFVVHLHGFLLAVMCVVLPVTLRPTNLKFAHVTANLATSKLQLETLIFGNSWLMIFLRFVVPEGYSKKYGICFTNPCAQTGCQPACRFKVKIFNCCCGGGRAGSWRGVGSGSVNYCLLSLRCHRKTMCLARFPAIFIHFHHVSWNATRATQFAGCHRWTTLTMWFAQNTQHDLSILLRPPRHLKTDTSNLVNAFAPEHATQRFKISPVTPDGFWHVPTEIEVARKATSARRNDLVQHLKRPQVTTLIAIAIRRATATSRARLRRRTRLNTVVDGCALSPGQMRCWQFPTLRHADVCVTRGPLSMREVYFEPTHSRRQRQENSPPATPSAHERKQIKKYSVQNDRWFHATTIVSNHSRFVYALAMA